MFRMDFRVKATAKETEEGKEGDDRTRALVDGVHPWAMSCLLSPFFFLSRDGPLPQQPTIVTQQPKSTEKQIQPPIHQRYRNAQSHPDSYSRFYV